MSSNFGVAIGITFFDVSFFILITTIGLNIIFGIIVDTFSQLRDSKVRCMLGKHSNRIRGQVREGYYGLFD